MANNIPERPLVTEELADDILRRVIDQITNQKSRG